jgi:hypothetical protein
MNRLDQFLQRRRRDQRVAGGETTGESALKVTRPGRGARPALGLAINARPASHPGRALVRIHSGGFTTGYPLVAPPALQVVKPSIQFRIA